MRCTACARRRQAGSVAWWRERGARRNPCGARGRARADPVRRQRALFRRAAPRAWRQSPIPAPRRGRRRARLLAALGPEALHARLADVDPGTAARLRPSDSQRIARACEVWRGTGKGLAAWQGSAGVGAGGAASRDPARSAARRAAQRDRRPVRRDARRRRDRRSARAAGARARPSLPAMRAHGVPELGAYLRRDAHPRRGRRAHAARHRPVHQAPGDLVPAPHAWQTSPTGIRSMRVSRLSRNFRKANEAKS